MSVSTFYIINIVGIVFGTLGIIASLVWPDQILEQHYFELILLPVLFAYLYTAIIMKVHDAGKFDELYDEKQNLNMTQAAALTWPASIGVVFILYILYQEEILTGMIFFPVFLYFTFTFYSASTLYFFKTN